MARLPEGSEAPGPRRARTRRSGRRAMSEYQYYEFLAIDRRLTGKQIEELRAYSTRARITPTTFVNEYSWGNFKGDEDAWVERDFDAFLHLANLGTPLLQLGLPARALD